MVSVPPSSRSTVGAHERCRGRGSGRPGWPRSRCAVGGRPRRAACLDGAAVLQDHQAVGEHHGVQRVVRDQQRVAAEVGEVPAQLGADLQAGAGVQRGQRFVEQQQARAGGQRTCQCDPLGLTAGQRAGLALRVARQPDPVEPACGLAPALRRGACRGPGGRTRRSPARSCARTAGSPGTPRRSGASRRARRHPALSQVDSPSADAARGQRRAARPAHAARWSCPRRSGRAARRPRPARWSGRGRGGRCRA